jgi:hypothetical protein
MLDCLSDGKASQDRFEMGQGFEGKSLTINAISFDVNDGGVVYSAKSKPWCPASLVAEKVPYSTGLLFRSPPLISYFGVDYS